MRLLVWILLLLLPGLAYGSPETLAERGTCYFQQERYLEAAIAFTAAADEDPEDSAVPLRYALTAAKKAIEQFGEDPADRAAPMVRLARSIRARIHVGQRHDWDAWFLRELDALETAYDGWREGPCARTLAKAERALRSAEESLYGLEERTAPPSREVSAWAYRLANRLWASARKLPDPVLSEELYCRAARHMGTVVDYDPLKDVTPPTRVWVARVSLRGGCFEQVFALYAKARRVARDPLTPGELDEVCACARRAKAPARVLCRLIELRAEVLEQALRADDSAGR